MADQPAGPGEAASEFRGVLTDLSDGMRSSLADADDWAEFAERLGALISELPTRRRQALVMLMFALSQHIVTPDQADAWISGHDIDSDDGVEQMIGWMRQFRPSRD